LPIHRSPMRCRCNVSNVRQRPVIRFHIDHGCVSECYPISPCSSCRPGLNQATKQGSRPNRLLHFQAFPFVFGYARCSGRKFQWEPPAIAVHCRARDGESPDGGKAQAKKWGKTGRPKKMIPLPWTRVT
jgi:hypothetical protein